MPGKIRNVVALRIDELEEIDEALSADYYFAIQKAQTGFLPDDAKKLSYIDLATEICYECLDGYGVGFDS